MNRCVIGMLLCVFVLSMLAACGGDDRTACPDVDGSTCRAHLTDVGDGTVRDSDTSLVWQQGFSSETLIQPDAGAYCTSLPLAGGGWRRPTWTELQSLLDTRFMPKINPSFFPGTPSECFWSSLIHPSRVGGYYVDFGTGVADLTDFSSYCYARCVR